MRTASPGDGIISMRMNALDGCSSVAINYWRIWVVKNTIKSSMASV